MAKGMVVDFSGVDSSGGRTRVPEGDYKVTVKDVKQQESKAGNQMLVWTFAITDGKFDGKKLIDRTVLTKESLWKLKQVLEAMGVTVPSKKVALDLKRYIDMELGVTVQDDEYEGKISSKVSDYVSLDVLEGNDVEDEEEDDDEVEEEAPKAKKGKRGKKGKKAPVEDDEDDDVEEIDIDAI